MYELGSSKSSPCRWTILNTAPNPSSDIVRRKGIGAEPYDFSWLIPGTQLEEPQHCNPPDYIGSGPGHHRRRLMPQARGSWLWVVSSGKQKSKAPLLAARPHQPAMSQDTHSRRGRPTCSSWWGAAAVTICFKGDGRRKRIRRLCSFSGIQRVTSIHRSHP